MGYKLKTLLREISGEINKFFTAKSFMTAKSEIKIFNEKKDIDSLRNYSKQNNFDIVLLKRKNDEISYIKSKDMENCKNKSKIIKAILKKDKININAQIPEIIDKFEELPCVFVYDKGSFKGLITYADLNNPSLYSYLYILISGFEKLLRNIIKLLCECEKDRWIKNLSDKDQGEIGGIFISNKAKGIELSLLECTTITQLKEILSKEKLYNEIKCYKSKNQYSSKLKKIIDYRNAIMHNRNLIKDKENYDDFYEFLYDFCTQRKEINNYYTELKKKIR